MSENMLNDDEGGRPYTGHDVLYREKGVSPHDVQRAADALLRLGKKPSIAAIREHLGGGSPNTLAPLLEKYWKGLGTRLTVGPDALERVPESLARITEALWLRSLDEARERTKTSQIGMTNSQKTMAALEGKVTELSAALAESRARSSELEAQLLESLRERLEMRELTQRLTALLKAEQELRVRDRGSAEARTRELQASRRDIVALARRQLASRINQMAAAKTAKAAVKSRATKPKSNRRPVSGGKRAKWGRLTKGRIKYVKRRR